MPQIRSRRRSAALAAGTLLFTAALSACGFNNATDQIYVPSAGVDYRAGTLDVLSAVIVSDQQGSGTFVATFSNNSVDTEDRVVALAFGAGSSTDKVIGFAPIKVKPTGFVNLALDPSIVITGDFAAGDYVDLAFDLANADDFALSVPVVAARDEWTGLDVSAATIAAATPTDAASPSASPTQ